MSINESNLKRALGKEKTLNTKLISLRKQRETENKKIIALSKKKTINTSDLTRLERYQKSIVKVDADITKVMADIQKNNNDINKYRDKVQQEQKRQYDKMMDSIKKQSHTNELYLESVSDISEKLNQLAMDVKITASEKEVIEYDVFLSHSNLDKEAFVTELSEKLSAKGLKVFEDVKVFKIGQSQIDMMNMGILNSRFVVIFLSPNFIKSGWSEYEFKSFLNREINENRIIILPIWHNISVEEVRQYNPYIVDKFALSTDKFSIDEIVEHISDVLDMSKV